MACAKAAELLSLDRISSHGAKPESHNIILENSLSGFQFCYWFNHFSKTETKSLRRVCLVVFFCLFSVNPASMLEPHLTMPSVCSVQMLTRYLIIRLTFWVVFEGMRTNLGLFRWFATKPHWRFLSLVGFLRLHPLRDLESCRLCWNVCKNRHTQTIISLIGNFQ